MRVVVECGPAYAIAYCHLSYNEKVHIEAEGMAFMSDGIEVSAGTGTGGIAKGLMRKAFGGESFFMGEYVARIQGAWVAAAPKYPGDIKDVDLGATGSLVVQSGALLAYADTVKVDVKVSGLSQAIATRGLTLLGVSGSGNVVLCSYGAICEFNVQEGQSMIIDTGHLVAYTATMKADTGMLGNAAVALATGENLVARIHGPGKIYVQTRAESQLTSWLFPDREQNER